MCSLEVKDVSQTKALLTEGFGAMLHCEDEPEHLDWRQLKKHLQGITSHPGEKASKMPTTDNIPKKASVQADTPLNNIFKQASQQPDTSFNNILSKLAASNLDIRKGTFLLNQIPVHAPEDNSEDHVNELKRRNTLCLPHLKSTYPLEGLPPPPQVHLPPRRIASSTSSPPTPSRDCLLHLKSTYPLKGLPPPPQVHLPPQGIASSTSSPPTPSRDCLLHLKSTYPLKGLPPPPQVHLPPRGIASSTSSPPTPSRDCLLHLKSTYTLEGLPPQSPPLKRVCKT